MGVPCTGYEVVVCSSNKMRCGTGGCGERTVLSDGQLSVSRVLLGREGINMSGGYWRILVR